MAYLATLNFKPNPHRGTDGLTPEAKRGEAVFKAKACDTCHAAPDYTTPAAYIVGWKCRRMCTKVSIRPRCAASITARPICTPRGPDAGRGVDAISSPVPTHRQARLHPAGTRRPHHFSQIPVILVGEPVPNSQLREQGHMQNLKGEPMLTRRDVIRKCARSDRRACRTGKRRQRKPTHSAGRQRFSGDAGRGPEAEGAAALQLRGAAELALCSDGAQGPALQSHERRPAESSPCAALFGLSKTGYSKSKRSGSWRTCCARSKKAAARPATPTSTTLPSSANRPRKGPGAGATRGTMSRCTGPS